MDFGWFAGFSVTDGVFLQVCSVTHDLFTCQSWGDRFWSHSPLMRQHDSAFSHWRHTNADIKWCPSYSKWPIRCHSHFRDFIKYIYFYFRRVLGRLTLADVCTAQMAWGGRYHLSSVRERESFQQHLTLRLTHNFIVPMNVLMRQNVFDRGKKKSWQASVNYSLDLRIWHFLGMRLASSTRKSNMVHGNPAA